MADIEYKINRLTESLMDDYGKGRVIDEIKMFEYPDRDVVIDILEKLRIVIYPGYYRNRNYRTYTVRNNISILLEDIIYNLIKQTSIVLKYAPEYSDADDQTIAKASEEITFKFLDTLPKIREYIETDIQAAYDGDPAAYNKDEIICTYPGLFAIFTSRVAHELFLLGVPMIPRIMTEHAHSLTGIDIHPGTTIGKYFFIDHGTGRSEPSRQEASPHHLRQRDDLFRSVDFGRRDRCRQERSRRRQRVHHDLDSRGSQGQRKEPGADVQLRLQTPCRAQGVQREPFCHIFFG